MLQMDGYDVLVGDIVFDTERGPGTVVEVRTDSFVVRFGSRITAFLPSGVASRRTSRTLYWHDPRIVVPAKDAKDWDRQKAAVLAFTDFVAKMQCGG